MQAQTGMGPDHGVLSTSATQPERFTKFYKDSDTKLRNQEPGRGLSGVARGEMWWPVLLFFILAFTAAGLHRTGPDHGTLLFSAT